jgi:hypothetical protein
MRPGGNLQVQRIVEPVSQISAPAGVLRGAIQDAENVILAVTFHASTKLMGMDGTVLAAVQGACVDVVLAPNASRLAWCTDDSLWTVDLAEGGGVLHRWSSTCVGSTGLFAVEGVVGKEKRAFLATIDGGFESLNWDSYGVERAPVNTGGSIGRVVSVGTDWQGGYLVVDDAGHLTGSGSLEILAERWAGDQWIAVDVVRRGDVVVAVGMTRGDDRATIRLGRIRNGELVDGTVSAAGAEAVAYVVRRPGNGVPARVIVSSVGQTSLYDIADVLGA